MDGGTDQSDPFPKRGGKRTEDMDYWIEPCHQFLIAFAEFGESVGLCSKNVRYGLGGMTGVELCSKWMGVKAFPSHGLILD